MRISVLGICVAAGLAPVIAAHGQSTTDAPVSAIPPATSNSTKGVVTSTTPKGVAGTKAGSREGYAPTTSDVANGPTPPRQTGRPVPSAVPSGHSPQNAQAPTYGNGRFAAEPSNVGNSSQSNGVLGANGARASATMQNGVTNRP